MLAQAQQQDSLQNAVWYVLLIGLGYAIKWGVDLILAKKSHEKMEVEMIKTSTDITLALQKVRKDYDDKGSECAAICDDLLRAIKAHKAAPTAETAEAVGKVRERYLSVLLGEYIGRCIDLFELEHADCYRDAIDIEQLVKEGVLPDLATIKKRLDVANLPELLKITERTPQKLEKRSFRRFRKLVRGVPADKRADFYTKIDSAIAQLSS